MKKLISIMLALVFVFSMATVAFAEEQDLSNVKDVQPKIYKTYQVNNGTAPAETFTFTFTGVSYVNGDGDTVENASIPAISPVTISFGAITQTSTEEATLNIVADSYSLGVYTYKVTETAGSTAGVTYDDTELYLVLTILRDEQNGKHFVAAVHYEAANGEKKGADGAIVNEYDSGSLSVTKKIAGNMAEMEKKFTFTITFNAPTNKNVNSTITVTKPDSTTETMTFTNGTATYTIDLGDENTVKFENLPEGVTYTVSEDADGYTASQNNVNGDIAAGDIDSVEITNTLNNGNIDTGISLDSVPFILILAVCAGAAILFVTKRRSVEF